MNKKIYRKLAGIIGCLTLVNALSVVNGGEFQANDFGAKADGKANNTEAIQKAIDAAAAAGGGTVTFESGTYLSGAIFLKSNVRLDLAEDVVLRAIQDDSLYPERPTRVAGIEMVWPTALVNVYQQTNVTITGKGKIDGNGEYWWRKFWGEDGKGGMLKDYQARGLRWAVDYDCKRVRALAVYDSSDITIKDITIERSGFWSLTLTYSHDIKVDGVIIRANINGFGPSSDGIDIDSSRDVLIQNCDIDCNDDNICLKAGRDWDGLRVNRPTKDITIRNCITRAGHGMLTLGSETSGGIRNVEVNGLKAFGTSNGIRFKSARVRGGVVENIVIHNIIMESVENPFHFELNWYPSYSYPTIPPEVDIKTMPSHWSVLTHRVEPAERGIPEFKNIMISNVTATGAAQAIYANAYPEKPMRGVRFENVRIEADTPGQISNAKDWTMKNVVITTASGSKLKLEHSKNVEQPTIQKKLSHSVSKRSKGSDDSPFMLGLSSPAEGGGEAGDRPALFLIGDSIVKNGAKGQQGWGERLTDQFETNRIRIINRALGGRSSRTYLTEELWGKVLAEIKPGDYVLMQFGHNDSGSLDSERARGSLPGIGEESQVITNKTTKVVETVHTYGWYLRRYVTDTKNRGASPIVVSPVPRNIWKEGHVIRSANDYAMWAREVAASAGVRFLNLNALVADRYDQLGETNVDKLFGEDHTHTNPQGAALNAEIVAQGLSQLGDTNLAKCLKANAAP